MQGLVVSGISHRFRWLSQSEGQIAHVLLTRSPLVYPRRGLTARLACVKHAASVRPEPGSNSPLKNLDEPPTKRQAALIDNPEEIHPGRSDPTPQKEAPNRFNLKESNNQQTPRNP